MEGTRNGLAYLGSANFTAHGWGFLGGGIAANVEAGLILRRSLQAATLDRLLPDLVGQPILLANANVQALQAPESGPEDDPWPEFIRQVLLSPSPADENQLQLLVEVAPGSAPLLWSAELPDKDGIPGETLVPLEATKDPSKISFPIPLSSQNLTRLLTEQEILICWTDCPSGRAVPLNVESSARSRLPISPSTQRIEETHLLSYYQGRIAWEELFPDPDLANGQGGSPAPPAAADAGVDKSRIQSYQIREFVEALTGLRQDLEGAAQSEPSMRLCTQVGQEGIDLHRHCRHVVHYDLAWNPAVLEQRTGRADRIGSKTFRERDAASDPSQVFLEVGVPFLAGTYDERMYEELRLRAQTFEVLTGGDFAADHADGQDDIAKPEGKELGLSVLPLPPQMIDDLRVKLQVWNPPRGSEPQRTDDGRSGDLRSLPQLHDLT